MMEKVLSGLEHCIQGSIGCHMGCPYADEPACRQVLCRDAISVLDAAQPRVMTLEKIQDGGCYWFEAGKDFVIRPVICIRNEEDAWKRYVCFAWQFGTFSWEADDYGKTWRCWTARPTEEQRKAVKWNE